MVNYCSFITQNGVVLCIRFKKISLINYLQ